MNKRKYKIVVEKSPRQEFTKYIPKVAETILRTGEIITDDKLKWETLPYGKVGDIGYVESKEEAQDLIERYELGEREREGDFILYEEEYKPKQR